MHKDAQNSAIYSSKGRKSSDLGRTGTWSSDGGVALVGSRVVVMGSATHEHRRRYMCPQVPAACPPLAPVVDPVRFGRGQGRGERKALLMSG